MSKVFIGIGAFVIGAYVQKKFDVCGKIEDLWEKFKESRKEEPEHVEDEE